MVVVRRHALSVWVLVDLDRYRGLRDAALRHVGSAPLSCSCQGLARVGGEAAEEVSGIWHSTMAISSCESHHTRVILNHSFS